MSATMRKPDGAEARQGSRPALYQLTYMSDSLLPGTPEQVATAVDAITADAQRSNLAMGITGALLYRGRRFSQVIEGPPDRVNLLMQRIQADPRHRAVTVLEDGAVQTRSFPSWSMAQLHPRGDFDWTLLDRMMSGFERMDRQRARSLLSMMQYCLMAQ